MITLPQAVIRHVRTVFRRLVPSRGRRRDPPVFGLLAGPGGVRFRFATEEVALEYLHDTPADQLRTSLPLELLAECEGSGQHPVTFQQMDTGQVEVRWQHKGQPHVRTYPFNDTNLPAFPDWPNQHSSHGSELLTTLRHAAETTAKDGTRFALHRLQLRGGTGEIVATDGRQLLVQRGFRFGWQEDLLVPACGILVASQLPTNGPVLLGRKDDYVLLRPGKWTVALQIDKVARFPHWQAVVPSKEGKGTHWQLVPEAIPMVLAKLRELPGAKEDSAPIEVELGKTVVLRGGDEGQTQAIPLVLGGCRVQGRQNHFRTEPHYLARALQLGFDRIRIVEPDKPIVCEDERRLYLWLPLGPQATAASPTVDHESSRSTATANRSSLRTRRTKRGEPQPVTLGNETGSTNTATADQKSWLWQHVVEPLKTLMNRTRKLRVP